MAQIYLIDTQKDSLTIRQSVNQATAVAVARGMLFIREENAGGKQDKLKEYWSHEGDSWLYNLKYDGSKVYCIVTN